ncbi:MAG: PAS domain S-box protein [Sphingomonas sp.]|jgi:PAS domain S-box-containing protein|uniref:hybrid sensor histidine kinase/response regulator n=1 Tax=Sphingomonas sp. TaxID=28214 RepID=UPI0035628A71
MKSAENGTQQTSRFELLVQSVTDYAIYMLDPAGVVISWNAGAERFKGYRADEIIGDHFSRFYTKEDRQAGMPARALETALNEGRFEAEGWRVRKDGTRFWANVVIDPIRDTDGSFIGFAKVTRDLSERRKAEEALRSSEERFRLLVQCVTDYAIYMLDPTGVIVSWNAGAQRFKGYTADEIVGEHFSRFYTEEDRKIGLPETALDTAARAGRFEAEGWRVRKDGTRFWASVVIDPVRDPAGKLLGFAKITRDLTERREAQQALDIAQEAFFQSQKMDAIGKLTGGVAHDFNNLLAVIIGSLDLARRRMGEGVDISRFLDNAMSAAERGATLTQRMLSFARRQELKLETVDVGDLVRGMAELVQRTIGAGISIDTEFPLRLAPVHADPSQLELAVMNLVVNARDAMPEGGRVTIEGREKRIGRGAELEPGDYVRLSVIDRGQGMDKATLARAMEPFFTTKGIGKGTGLGLSMVHGFAEQCGGRLILKSRPGKGTKAELWLPISKAAAGEDSHSPAVVPQIEMEPLVVLTVDDDALVLMNTAAMLEDMGHRVLQATSAREALAMLDREAVDLVVTDYAMPVMTGADLAAALPASMPVLIVSGYAEIPAGAEAMGVRLNKPFRDEQLARAVREAMRLREATAIP